MIQGKTTSPRTPYDNHPKCLRKLALMLAALLLVGCAAQNDSSRQNRRTAGTIFDDQSVEYQLVNHLYSSEELTSEDHIKVEVHRGIVLLLGETISESNRELAEKRAGQLSYVKRVVNELTVSTSDSVIGRLENAWLTTKVVTALTAKNPIQGFDATRIKVVTANNTVYLMGVVTREEGDAVAEVARNVSRVEKVVKVFDYGEN
jgi:osmotically-inducible protein OsmY